MTLAVFELLRTALAMNSANYKTVRFAIDCLSRCGLGVDIAADAARIVFFELVD